MRILIVAIVWILAAHDLHAQRKRDKKLDAAQQTPESAANKAHEDRERKVGEYQSTKKHHQSIQDEATRKRMKKNLKKAERHSWGKGAPWYKRWFKRNRH